MIKWVFLILFLVKISTSEAPQVTSATYQIKETNLDGVEATHAVIRIQTNQELYYYNDPICGCQRNMTECRNKRTSTAIVNENGYNVTILDKDKLYNFGWVNYEEIKYFKIFLDPSTHIGCPIIKIEHNLNIGDANMVMSNEIIPSHTNYKFIKYGWFRDAYWICPSNYEWQFGWWYIAILPDTPRVEHLSYSLRWSTKNSDQCISQPSPVSLPPPLNNHIILQNNIPYERYFEPRKFYYFVFDSPNSDIGISARMLNFKEPGDFDIFVSTTDMWPSTMKSGRNEFSSAIEHEDYLTLKSVSGNSSRRYYIGLWNWQGNGNNGSIVANPYSDTWAKSPLIINGPLQIKYTLANDFARLVCGENGQEEFRSAYPSYDGVLPGDQWGGQMPMYPIPLTYDTTEVNHIWPITKEAVHFGYLNKFNWAHHPNISINKKGLLMLAVSISLRKMDDFKRYIVSPINTCYIRWNGVLCNSDGEPLVGITPIVEDKEVCDRIAFKILLGEVRNIMSTMVRLSNYDDLKMAQMKLEFLSYSNTWHSCKREMIDTIFNTTQHSVSVNAKSKVCDKYVDSDEWRTDPCCTVRAQLDSYCPSSVENDTRIIPASLQYSSISGRCGTPECASQRFNALLMDAAKIQDPIIGCTNAFNLNAGPFFLSESTNFYKQCRQKILGDTLQGKSCEINSDCIISEYPFLRMATCDQKKFICGYNDTDVLSCWVKTIDPLISRSLFDLWKIPDNVVEDRLMQELQNRFMDSKDTCVGATGIRFRESFNFASEYSTCFDLCHDPATNLDLQPYCFEQEDEYCPIPLVCSTWLPPANWCWRQFFHRSDQSRENCISEKKCNWIDCTSHNSTCESNCNASSTQFVCIECTKEKGCIGRSDLTQSQCVNTTSTGYCSIPCAGELPCSNQTACESTGMCVGKESIYGISIFEYYNRTGLCFSPYISDYLGNTYCGGRGPFDWPDGTLAEPESHYGCVCSNEVWSHPNCNLNITQSSCASNGYIWVNDDKTKNECDSSVRRCFDEIKAPTLNPSGVYNLKSLQDCNGAGQKYQSVNRWISGTWIKQTKVNRFWESKKFESINKWDKSIDYINFNREISVATMQRVALAYSTEALCRYNSELNALDAYTCDCGVTGNNCYEQNTNYEIAVYRACPYISQIFDNSQVIINTTENSFNPVNFCQNVYLSLYPSFLFDVKSSSKLSSEIFLPRLNNPYAVVITTKSKQVIGQLLTNGINITWDSNEKLPDPITICIPQQEITWDKKSYPIISFAKITLKSEIVYDGIAIIDDVHVCFRINTPGIYFGAATVKDVSDPVSALDKGMFITSTILYILCNILVIIQTIRYYNSKSYRNPGIFLLKQILLAVLMVFFIFRIIYMIFLITGITLDASTNSFIVVIFEIPSVLCFPMEMGIFYIWRTIVNGVKKMKALEKNVPLPKIFIYGNLVLLITFIIVTIVFYTIREDEILPCYSLSSTQLRYKHMIVNISYQVILAILSVLLAVIYCYEGSVFIRASEYRAEVIKMTMIVISTFGTMNIAKCSLILWSAWTGAVVPVLLFTFLEIIPLLVLSYYILPLYKKKKNNSSRLSSGTPSKSNKSNNSTTTTADMNSTQQSF